MRAFEPTERNSACRQWRVLEKTSTPRGPSKNDHSRFAGAAGIATLLSFESVADDLAVVVPLEVVMGAGEQLPVRFEIGHPLRSCVFVG